MIEAVGDGRSAEDQARIDWLKDEWSTWAEGLVLQHDDIKSFWMTILRPESNLD